MGIVNATPDSFSDAGLHPTLPRQVDLAMRQVTDGAAILDIGGESASPRTRQLGEEEEIARVVPLIEAVRARCDVTISVDTYKARVARAAVEAGASLVNDISGLRDLELARLCAERRVSLVIMHNRGVPKQYLLDADLYEDVVQDVVDFLQERIAAAVACGLIRDPDRSGSGPDFSKTPAQTIEVLRNLAAIKALGHSVLLPISRKDFIGALTSRRPRERLPGTLAALAHGIACDVDLVRLHDVAAGRAFIEARLALANSRQLTD